MRGSISFAQFLHPDAGNADLLDALITAVRAAGLPHLRAFTRRMDDDKAAVQAALTRPYSQRRDRGREHEDETDHAVDAWQLSRTARDGLIQGR